MRDIIAKLGRVNVTVILTLLSVAASVVLATLALSITGNPVLPISIKISIFVPLVIAPAVTWPIIGLLLQIDRLEKKIRADSHFDELTGLMSRRYFFDNAEQYFGISLRYDKIFSILLLDLDHFKRVNDTYGHIAGDVALRSIGARFAEFKRESDIVGRFGGEEFIFLLPETESAQAVSFAEKLRKMTEKTLIEYQGVFIHLTLSVGIATFSPASHPESLIQLINEADKALYAAKKSGRNRVIAFKE